MWRPAFQSRRETKSGKRPAHIDSDEVALIQRCFIDDFAVGQGYGMCYEHEAVV
jgi:hypothetical protein